MTGPLTAMSRAVSSVLKESSTDGTIGGLPDKELDDFLIVLAAFGSDLRVEHDRRLAAKAKRTEGD